MNQVFADTGYWIALLNVRDELHTRATSLSTSIGDAQIVTSEWILTELLNDLSNHGEMLRNLAAQTVAALYKNEDFLVVPFDVSGFPGALELYRRRADKNWSLTDCSSFLIMKKMGLTDALSHDQHFVQAGFIALMRT